MGNWQNSSSQREQGDRSHRKTSWGRTSRRAPRSLRLEPFEERILFAITGPQFVALIPSDGSIIQNSQVLHVAPHEFTLRFSGILDPSSLGSGGSSAIQFTRGGLDRNLTTTGDNVTLTPSYYNIGANPNEVIVRFDLSLPDDLYQVRIVGAGAGALKDAQGNAFNSGQDLTQTFKLDLGAQVVAVVPQPIPRDAAGKLTQSTNEIDVYFNSNDPLDYSSATNKTFYQLIRTNGSAATQDDLLFNPISVSYDAASGKAVLIFNAADISTPGAYRLRVGNNDPLSVTPVVFNPTGPSDNSSFGTASDLGSIFGATQGVQTGDLSGTISNSQVKSLFGGIGLNVTYPGSPSEPGQRDPQIESHISPPWWLSLANNTGTVPVLSYNFQAHYGDVQGQPVYNLITETQKQRVREAFSYWSHYLGVEFVETASAGFTIATGDVRAIYSYSFQSTYPYGVDQGYYISSSNFKYGEAILNSFKAWGSSEAGGDYFASAMAAIGQLLGLGPNYEAPPLTLEADYLNNPPQSKIPGSSDAERVFPGDLDLTYGKYLLPPVGNDVNVYKFTLPNSGQLNLETIAERLGQLDPSKNPSQLDTVITLYDANHNILARNDNYYGKDSFVQMTLNAGAYYVAVTSTGNTKFDPATKDTGFGGTTQGDYQLRFTFTPTQTVGIKDTTGTLLDGDGNGAPGEAYNFWFQVADTAHTFFVDKAAVNGTGALGSITNPFTNIATALAAATPGSIVRIVGNGGGDNDLGTTGNNLSYNIGFDSLNHPLADGSKFEIPRGVTVMIDAGAIIKLRGANIDVGSSAQGIDHGAGALQVLGTPATEANPSDPAHPRDIGTVFFTSYYDNTIGNGTAQGILVKGNWGGLVFHDDSDLEANGIFLNYVNHANLRFGGGQVVVNSVLAVYNPIHLESTRPTISYNTIDSSADSAISADPNSFEESEFQGIASGGNYYADYSRVGPWVHANTLTNNSINALFIRIRTQNGQNLDPLTVSARLANTDIVYALHEVLEIQGSPGGMIQDANGKPQARPSARLAIDPGIIVKLGGARIETQMGATFLAEGTQANPVIFTSIYDDSYGAGGNSDTTNDGNATTPGKGNWSGLFFGPMSIGSIDHAMIAYAGGISSYEGNFDNFNPVEIHQAQVRLTNSILENNAAGGGGDRGGRGTSDASVIFIRGAQPVILNNTIENNSGVAISANLNALNSDLVDDWGRNRGPIDFQGSFLTNSGPLIRNNRIGNNDLNGMIVRGGTLTTDGVWDDTDIVHVVKDAIYAPNQQALTGTLRLQSSSEQSLVVKLYGTDTGIIATGTKLDITDRTGGTVQIVGVGNHPVVLTSIKDDTVGAGLTPDGKPQKDTLNRKGVIPPPPPNLATQGPVIIDNAPRDEHGGRAAAGTDWIGDGWTELKHMVQYIFESSRNTAVPEGNKDVILAIGWHDDKISGHKTYSQDCIETVAKALNLKVQWYGTDGQTDDTNVGLSVMPFYKMVFIPSDSQTNGGKSPDFRPDAFKDDTVFGGILDFQIKDFTDRRDEIWNYVNNLGGGLLALSEATAAAPYSWVGTAKSDTIVIKPTGGNILTQTALAPAAFATYGLTDTVLNWGLPWLASFKGTTGFDRLQPFMVDPVTGQYEMLGLAPGGPGVGPPQDVVRPGDWDSIRLDTLSNDRNVVLVNETEQAASSAGDLNGTPASAQYIGQLAKDLASGDDNVRLGFEIHGGINQAANPAINSNKGDVDVYSFTGTTGTDVWMDIDRTSPGLDSVLELVDANGAVIARSDNSLAETSNPSLLVGIAQRMQPGLSNSLGVFTNADFFGSNPLDAGMRVVLPGTPGQVNTYFVRVRSSSPDLTNLNGGLTKGAYVLQLRLQNVDEFPGSTVQNADIRYATNGVEVVGKPEHSPLIANTSESQTSHGVSLQPDPNNPNGPPLVVDNSQDLGNLLGSDRGTLTGAGNLSTPGEVDWYKFEMALDLHSYIGTSSMGTLFQINYADGLGRANTALSVYDSAGKLIYIGSDSNIADSQPRPGLGADTTNLSHGSFGVLDPTIGTVMLPASSSSSSNSFVYYVAVYAETKMPQAVSLTYGASTIDPAFNPLLRLEPIDSVNRVIDDHGGSSGGNVTTAGSSTLLNVTANPYQLGDVVLYVNTYDVNTNKSGLEMVDPLTGAILSADRPNNALSLPDIGTGFRDIAMRNDGKLFTLSQGNGATTSGNYVQINTADGSAVSTTDDGISTFSISAYTAGTPGSLTTPGSPGRFGFQTTPNLGIQFEAMAFQQSDTAAGASPVRRLFAIGNRAPNDLGGSGSTPINGKTIASVTETSNLLFELDPNTGQALNPSGDTNVFNSLDWGGAIGSGSGTDYVPIGALDVGSHTSGSITLQYQITGMAVVGNKMFAVTNGGGFFEITGFAGTPTNSTSQGPGFQPAAALPKNTVKDKDGNVVAFTGLTAGPPHVENGVYANTLFATDSTGKLWAFDTGGNLVPVFLNGSTSIATGITNPQGLAFSSLDYNLWHVSDSHATDLGHGIPLSPDGNIRRDPTYNFTNQLTGNTNNSSYYFGLDTPTNTVGGTQPGAANYATNSTLYNTYSLPGGAYGSLTSGTFSLEGYSTGDAPTLYFNYLLDTTNADKADPIQKNTVDTLRVMATTDGVNWELVATNNVTPTLETPQTVTPTGGAYKNQSASQKIQPLWDDSTYTPTGTTVAIPIWRQARVDLGDYAGKSNIRLRFDFSSAGSMGSTNVTMGTGQIIKVPAGSQIQDGQNFKIDNNTTYTFRTGFSLTVNPAGNLIQDGQTFTVNGKTFEFNTSGGVTPGNLAININGQLSPNQIASAIFQALQANAAQIPGVTPHLSGVRIQLSGATSVTSASPAVPVSGSAMPGSLTSTDIVLDIGMNATAVATAIAQALERNTNFSIGVPAGGGQAIADGETLTLNGHTFEFDKNGSVAPGNIAIPITNSQSASDVALAITRATGYSLNVTVPSASIADGKTFAINGATFEFNQVGGVAAGNIPVTISSATTPGDVATLIARAAGYNLTISGGGLGITDGQTFSINGKTFEFDKDGTVTPGNIVVDVKNANTANDVATAIVTALGATLTVSPSGGFGILDGDQMVINGHTFEFDKNGSFTPGNTPIFVSNLQSASDVALAIARAVGFYMTAPGNGSTINDGSTFVINGQTFEFDKNGSVVSGRIAVPITNAFSANDVALAIARAAGDSLKVTAIGSNITDGTTFTINGHTFEFDTNGSIAGNNTPVPISNLPAFAASDVALAIARAAGYNLNVSGGGSSITDGQTFTLNGKTFEFDKGGGVSGTNIAIPITNSQTPDDVALMIARAVGVSLNVSNPGSSIVDGQTFAIDGHTFEFDKNGLVTLGNIPVSVTNTQSAGDVALAITRAAGYNLTVPVNGLAITDGTTFIINGQTFEFDKDGNVNPANTIIPITDTLTANDVALAIARKTGYSMNVSGSVGSGISDGQTFTINGKTFEFDTVGGVAAGNTRVALTNTSSSSDVALAIARAAGTSLTFKSGLQTPDGELFTVNGTTFEFDKDGSILGASHTPVVITDASTANDVALAVARAMGYSLSVFAGSTIADGQTLTINGKTFEFDKDGSVSGTHIAIPITSAQTPSEVATSAYNVLLANTGTTGVTPYLNGALIDLVNATTVASASNGVTITLPVSKATPYLNGATVELTNALTVVPDPTDLTGIVTINASIAGILPYLDPGATQVDLLNATIVTLPSSGASLTLPVPGVTSCLNPTIARIDLINASMVDPGTSLVTVHPPAAGIDIVPYLTPLSTHVDLVNAKSVSSAANGVTAASTVSGVMSYISGNLVDLLNASSVSTSASAVTINSPVSGAVPYLAPNGTRVDLTNTTSVPVSLVSGVTPSEAVPGVMPFSTGNRVDLVNATSVSSASTVTVTPSVSNTLPHLDYKNAVVALANVNTLSSFSSGITASVPLPGILAYNTGSRVDLVNASNVVSATPSVVVNQPIAGAVPYLDLNGTRIDLVNASTVTSLTTGVTPFLPIPGVLPTLINNRVGFTGVSSSSQSNPHTISIVGSNGIFTIAKPDGETLRLFGHTITSTTAPLIVSSTSLPGDIYGTFNSTTRDRSLTQAQITQNIKAPEGAYIDDIIVGFAGRGEMVTNAAPNITNALPNLDFVDTPRYPGDPFPHELGAYQLSIRRATSYAYDAGTSSTGTNLMHLYRSFDINDRLASAFALVAVPAVQIPDGSTFSINDGSMSLTFEFDWGGGLSDPNNIPIALHIADSANAVALAITNAIMNAVGTKGFKVRASLQTGADGNPTGSRINLFDAVDVNAGPLGEIVFNDFGDPLVSVNAALLQGQTIIQGAAVTHSRQVGIQVVPKIGPIHDTGFAFSEVSYFDVGGAEFAGSVANLPTSNTQRWVPGVTLENNLVADSGRTGIEFSGSPNAGLSYAQVGFDFTKTFYELFWFRNGSLNFINYTPTPDNPFDVQHFVPFGRIVNNTVYGAINGIAAVNGSSPTIINNIVANTGVAKDTLRDLVAGSANLTDASTTSTVLATVVYQSDVLNNADIFSGGAGIADSQSITLQPNDPLFVNSAKGNFYLAEKSQAIDSSINSVQDRFQMTAVTSPLGVPPSPIQAPQLDLLGQLRVDDPNVPSPPGFGSNVFKDRGAVERADFSGPTAVLVNPVDNDAAGSDRDPTVNKVVLLNAQLTSFDIQLPDGSGVGVDDSTVDVSKFTLTRTVGATTTPLTPGVDFVLSYDTNSKIARLVATQGIWLNGAYQITLDNSPATGIKDLASNVLQPNNLSGTTQFVIQLTDQLLSGWQNPTNKYDVNNDGRVSGLDALMIINRLLLGQGGTLPVVATAPPYVDVNGDGKLSPLDALQVINYLNAHPPGAPLPSTTTTLVSAAASLAPALDLNPVTTSLAMSPAVATSSISVSTGTATVSTQPSTASTASAAASLPTLALAPDALASTFETEETLDFVTTEMDDILTDLTADMNRLKTNV